MYDLKKNDDIGGVRCLFRWLGTVVCLAVMGVC